MEIGKYGRVPAGVSEQLKKDYQEKRRKEQK
jgi:elongation factor G